MERVFNVVWVGCLLLFFGSSPWLPEQVGDPGKEMPRLFYIALLGFTLWTTPWIVGPGMVRLLRGMGSGGVNLPHAAYWFEGERRAESLKRLEPYNLEVGCVTAVFLLAVSAAVHFPGEQVWGLKLGLFLTFTLTGALLLWLAAWMVRVMRAFPKPPLDADLPAAGPRRPRRPGE
ncbi:hypothetical protein [Inhella gelatinilytica]|uniref:Uncharacterized protein n=1 Tax=Inhella gelatinilytica TaxID=2795030 RepID=A0A931IW42_9BURK|nr:hypothetical protein [Inhella gelatinilytica]MBH9553017.1 hypothetical protein [Inhella gelatinilytica]